MDDTIMFCLGVGDLAKKYHIPLNSFLIFKFFMGANKNESGS